MDVFRQHREGQAYGEIDDEGEEDVGNDAAGEGRIVLSGGCGTRGIAGRFAISHVEFAVRCAQTPV